MRSSRGGWVGLTMGLSLSHPGCFPAILGMGEDRGYDRPWVANMKKLRTRPSDPEPEGKTAPMDVTPSFLSLLHLFLSWHVGAVCLSVRQLW